MSFSMHRVGVSCSSVSSYIPLEPGYSVEASSFRGSAQN